MKFTFFRRTAAAALALLTISAGTILPAGASYDDFDEITSHVSTSVTQRLQITRPSKDLGTSAENYYLTGTSNPQYELTLNGEPVENRGEFGSWAAYVPLGQGENVFTLENGGDRETVRITRGGGITVATTKIITSPTPVYDVAVTSGATVTLSCNAPSGARVTASVAGKKITLSQVAAASDGVPARFKGEFSMPSASGTQETGPVTYTLDYAGNTTTYTSAGSLFAVGEGATLLVEMKDTASVLFETESKASDFVATAKQGAVDYVTEIGDSMYHLGMGGWVPQESARPLVSGTYRNDVSSVGFETGNNSERYVFSGTGRPIASAYQDSEKLYIRFAHTSGIESVPVGESELFSRVDVNRADGDTVLEFMLSGERTLWGYAVEYDGEGNTIVTCKYRPVLSSGSQPLRGVTVALDPGHGGTDSGALGISNTSGPMEKDITYDTTIAVKKRLESLGATVVLTRSDDSAVGLSERMKTSQDEMADFFIALHCNSIAANTNGLKPNGIEVYYYENIAKDFAETVLSHAVSETGRASRGAKYSVYKVTLASYAPALLVEMGFLTNPAEYDDLCSRRGMFNMANAIGDALVSYLS